MKFYLGGDVLNPGESDYSITVPLPVFRYSSSIWLTKAIRPWKSGLNPRESHQSGKPSGLMSARRAIVPLSFIISICCSTRALQVSKLQGIFPESIKIVSARRKVASSLYQAIPMTSFILIFLFILKSGSGRCGSPHPGLLHL